jgi:hypothetical protein
MFLVAQFPKRFPEHLKILIPMIQAAHGNGRKRRITAVSYRIPVNLAWAIIANTESISHNAYADKFRSDVVAIRLREDHGSQRANGINGPNLNTE